MEISLIIPIHKQYKHWLKMMSGIEKQSMLPKNVYLMLDRPTDEEYEYMNSMCSSSHLKNNYVIKRITEPPEYVGKSNNIPSFDLFLTGYNRNLAIDYALDDGSDIVVMIDGDCIPEVDLIKSHYEINNIDVPSITCGRRKEVHYNWLDQRDVEKKLSNLNLFTSGNGYLIQNQLLLQNSSIIWTCNIGINKQAIKLIKKLNKKYYGRSEVFNSEFLGSWGGEDSFLGIQASMLKIFVSMITGEKSGVRHIDHPRPVDKYGKETFATYLKNQLDLLNEMQINNPLTLTFFKKEHACE